MLVHSHGQARDDYAATAAMHGQAWDGVKHGMGGLDHLLPKFEHIFVASITFSPFLLCRYF